MTNNQSNENPIGGSTSNDPFQGLDAITADVQARLSIVDRLTQEGYDIDTEAQYDEDGNPRITGRSYRALQIKYLSALLRQNDQLDTQTISTLFSLPEQEKYDAVTLGIYQELERKLAHLRETNEIAADPRLTEETEALRRNRVFLIDWMLALLANNAGRKVIQRLSGSTDNFNSLLAYIKQQATEVLKSEDLKPETGTRIQRNLDTINTL